MVSVLVAIICLLIVILCFVLIRARIEHEVAEFEHRYLMYLFKEYLELKDRLEKMSADH